MAVACLVAMWVWEGEGDGSWLCVGSVCLLWRGWCSSGGSGINMTSGLLLLVWLCVLL
jgi:hypothetical protein